MCDYSLMHFPNRLAVEGEELIAYRFPSGSMGLASPADVHQMPGSEPSRQRSFWEALGEVFRPVDTCPVKAVCVPPSARLLLRDIGPRFQREHGVHSEEEATFEQLTASAHTYRDAIRFRNGRVVRLQELPDGQRVTVLDVSSREADVPNAEPVSVPSRQGDLVLR